MKTLPRNHYLDKLFERQHREGWSDREMSRQSGIGVATWHRLKHGERALSLPVLQKLMARFPEYNAVALLFLSSDVPVENDHVPHEERETADVA